jgi:DNA-binding transcriptional regulator YiaG
MQLGLYQRQLADLLGVTVSCIWNWENNAAEPATRCLPIIFRFLGYNPLPKPSSLAEKIVRFRHTLGLTQEALSRKLGVDESTIAHWEQGRGRPTSLYRMLIETLIADGEVSEMPETRY